MVKSAARTVEEYLRELPEERRAAVAEVRRTILAHLPAGYEETVRWGMITSEVPLKRYPDTHNDEHLGYAALAVQKNTFALYLMGAYQDGEQAPWLAREFARPGEKLDMGTSCIRFNRLADLPLDVIGRAIAHSSPDEFVAQYEAARLQAR